MCLLEGVGHAVNTWKGVPPTPDTGITTHLLFPKSEFRTSNRARLPRAQQAAHSVLLPRDTWRDKGRGQRQGDQGVPRTISLKDHRQPRGSSFQCAVINKQ